MFLKYQIQRETKHLVSTELMLFLPTLLIWCSITTDFNKDIKYSSIYVGCLCGLFKLFELVYVFTYIYTRGLC